MIELPGYKIIRELGRGGMARVYLATHEGLQRDVAIKVMFKNLGDDSTFSDRFIREARIVAQLSHHNIITVYDVGVHNGDHYIAMEFLPGETLDDKIKKGIKPEHALKLIKQISAGLQFAHNKNFIHRDIKPENILFREDNTPIISDFGIARAIVESETKMTAEGTVIGTALYMSPEQAQGKPITGCADIYSLGIVFYEMLTGEVPYNADTSIAIVFKHIQDPIPELGKDLKKYQSILNKMLAKDPDKRYQSGNEIISDIEALEHGLKPPRATEFMAQEATVGGRGTELLSASKNTKNRWKWISASIGTVILIVGLASYILYYVPQQEQITAEREQQTLDEKQSQEASEKKRLAAENSRKLLAEKQEKSRIDKLAADKKDKAELEKINSEKALVDKIAATKRQQEADIKKKQELEKKKKRAQALRIRQEKINKLLATAESNYSKVRLQGAYNNYREVLKLDSKNTKAKSGINKVAGKYLNLAEKEAIKENFEKAEAYLTSANSLAPSHIKRATTEQTVFNLRSEYIQRQAAKAIKDNTVDATPQEPVKKPEKSRRTFVGF